MKNKKYNLILCVIAIIYITIPIHSQNSDTNTFFSYTPYNSVYANANMQRTNRYDTLPLLTAKGMIDLSKYYRVDSNFVMYNNNLYFYYYNFLFNKFDLSAISIKAIDYIFKEVEIFKSGYEKIKKYIPDLYEDEYVRLSQSLNMIFKFKYDTIDESHIEQFDVVNDIIYMKLYFKDIADEPPLFERSLAMYNIKTHQLQEICPKNQVNSIGTICMNSDTVYYINGSTVNAYNIVDQKVIYKFSIAKEIYQYQEKRLMYDNSVLFYGYENNIFAWKAKDGSFLWQQVVDRSFNKMEDMAIGKKNVYCKFKTKLVALEKTTGKMQWVLDFPTILTSQVAVCEDYIYFGDKTGNLYCYNGINGKKVWEMKLKSYLLDLPIISNGNLFFVDQSSSIIQIY